MKHKILYLFVILCFPLVSFCQISKGSWLLGGNINFTSLKYKWYLDTDTVSLGGIQVLAAPDLGYFVVDKLAVGIRPKVAFYKSPEHKSAVDFEAGPFARYYFLDAYRPFNLIADVGYQIGRQQSAGYKFHTKSFTISSGVVIYFNDSTSAEFIVGYYRLNGQKANHADELTQIVNAMQVSIGLQVYF